MNTKQARIVELYLATLSQLWTDRITTQYSSLLECDAERRAFEHAAAAFRMLDEDCLLGRIPAIGKSLDTALAHGRESEWHPETSVELDPILQLPIFREVREGSPTAVAAVRQLTLLFSKYRLSQPTDESPHIEAFLRRNQEMLDFKYAGSNRILRAVSTCLAFCIGSCDLSLIQPNHSNGAVFPKVENRFKWRMNVWSDQLEEAYPYADYGCLNYTQLAAESLDENGVNVKYIDPISKLASVPKDFRGPRLICVEPVCQQYVQKGIQEKLYAHLESHAFTRGHVNFTDQSINQTLVMDPGFSRNFATLDLKDASDLIPYSLWYQLCPLSVRRRIHAARTRRIQVNVGSDKECIEAGMLTTMGGCICFPLEACWFFSIAVATIACQKSHRFLPSRQEFEAAARQVYVYGDDLIVPLPFAEEVMNALIQFGAKPNLNKCCMGPNFRETCGVDVYKGKVVTPIRLKTLPQSDQPETYSGCLDSINNLRKAGMRHVAECLLSQVREEGWQFPYVTSGGGQGIICSTFSEAIYENQLHGIRRRFSKKHQRPEVRGFRLVSPIVSSPLTPYQELHHSIVVNGGVQTDDAARKGRRDTSGPEGPSSASSTGCEDVWYTQSVRAWLVETWVPV